MASCLRKILPCNGALAARMDLWARQSHGFSSSEGGTTKRRPRARRRVGWLRYINDFTSPADAEKNVGPALSAGTPYIIHLCEGTDIETRDYFDNLKKADGSSLIGPPLVTIHCVALDGPQFQTLATNRGAGVVWSPLSNFLLYGATTKVALPRQAGLPVAIGCDWAPSGTKNLLGELKITKLVSDHEGGLFTDQELIDAVTHVPASMIGWDSYVGSIERDKAADLVVREEPPSG